MSYASLGTVKREKLLEALAKLSRGQHDTGVNAREVVVLVNEVCLEFVCREWREVAGRGEEGVREIARKLTEVEIEASP